MTNATFWLFYILAPQIGLMPVPNSPAFTDQTTCERALERANPFLPGKTACWPQPWHYEEPTEGSVSAKPLAPGVHVD